MAALLTAAACSPEDSTGGGEGGPDSAAAESTIARETPVYIALARSEDFPTPDTGDVASIEIVDGCLTLVTDRGERHLPVFPAGTRFDDLRGEGAAMSLNGTRIALGREVALKGGVSDYSPASTPPAACPDTTFLVGGLM
jgi:hypothetical protein